MGSGGVMINAETLVASRHSGSAPCVVGGLMTRTEAVMWLILLLMMLAALARKGVL